MDKKQIVGWLERSAEEGILYITGFHTDLESVPEHERPPHILLDEIPTPPTKHGMWIFNEYKQAVLWIESEPAVPEPTDVQVVMAITLDLYAALEAKGVI